eukprot:m.308964 g.308964  ORF g.308964 m.308964 type:complete len:150 (+) comp45182_c0_seq1:28-477(+)
MDRFAEAPNSAWTHGRNLAIFYVIAIIVLHYLLMSLPFVTVAQAWTLTNCLHSTLQYLFLHYLKGAPFDDETQGRSRRMTHWEQIDEKEHWTPTKKFLTIVPIILFILASFYTNYQLGHFWFNFLMLLVGVVPKFPLFYRKRFFGINEY